MTKKQTEAQRLAAELESTWCDESCVPENKAAALLRRQDELLKQALEALDGMLQIYGGTELTRLDGVPIGASSTEVECCNQARDALIAIRSHLEAMK